MSWSSLALTFVFAALFFGGHAEAQSLPAQTAPAGPPSPPASFTLGPTPGVDVSDITSLIANCQTRQGLVPSTWCHPYQVQTVKPSLAVPDETPFRLNPQQWSSKDWQDSAKNLTATSFSLHVAGNLATEDSTRTFLKGIGGDALAAKAPEIFEMIKSPALRYGVLAGMVIGGTVYLYEGLWGGSSEKSPQSNAPQKPTFHLLDTVSQGSSIAPAR